MRKIIVILTLFFSCGAGLAQTYHVGDLLTAPDGSKGIVYYLHPDGSGGWAVALTDASTGCTWGTAVDVPGLVNQDSYYDQNLLIDTAGYANTQTLRYYQNNSTEYAAGVVDFAHGWVLPSPAQLSVLYCRLPFIENNIIDAGGTILTTGWYWCSAEQNDANAWLVDFNTGAFRYTSKNLVWPVRAVRSFSYAEPQYSYQWSTGATTPDITVNPSQTTTYTVTVYSSGCTDTVNHAIVVNSATAQTYYDEICQGGIYQEHGFDISATENSVPGTYTYYNTVTVSGCEATDTLYLTVNPATNTQIVKKTCDSYEWNGELLTESGSYTRTFSLQTGCDSVVTLNLTITELEVEVYGTNSIICSGDSVVLSATVTNAAELAEYEAPPIAVGDILCTDNSIVKPYAWPVAGKTAMGIVFYVDETQQHGWAVNLHDQSSGNMRWCTMTNDLASLNNYTTGRTAASDTSGYTNTRNIRSAVPLLGASVFPVPFSVDFNNGWYLPAAGQLRFMLVELPRINPSLSIVGGTPFDSSWWYWSSTENSGSHVWTVQENGMMDLTGKNGTSEILRARSVRSF